MEDLKVLPIVDKIVRELKNWELEGIDSEEGYLEVAKFLVDSAQDHKTYQDFRKV